MSYYTYLWYFVFRQARRRVVGRKAGRRAKFGRRGRTAHPDPAPEALPDEDVPVEDENALDDKRWNRPENHADFEDDKR